MGIAERLSILKEELGCQARLVAVSKTKTTEEIMEAYQAGQRIFGENKVQELTEKQPRLPDDIQWHFIGHLQTNKVKYIAPFVHLIHSADSLKLLQAIDREGEKNNRVIKCLLQFHIADEETKFGFDPEEATNTLLSEEFRKLKFTEICGVMGMATFTDREDQVRHEFRSLKQIFGQMKQGFFKDKPGFCEISMGMSGDYPLAIEEGSTMVRIGSLIFGERNYGSGI